jgi:hypothetical protein
MGQPPQLDNTIAACISAPPAPHTIAPDAYLTLNPLHWPCTVRILLAKLNQSNHHWDDIWDSPIVTCPAGGVTGMHLFWGALPELNGTYETSGEVVTCDPASGQCWVNTAWSPMLFFTTGGYPD